MTVRRLSLLVLLAAGCKSADKGGPLGLGVFGKKSDTPSATATGNRASADPLLTNGRIPPQDLPVPGKDGLARNTGRDPLLGPAGGVKDDRPIKTAGATKEATPSRPDQTGKLPPASVPYRPSSATSPAALAARIDPNDPKYAVGDDPPPLSVPRQKTADDYLRELKKLGAVVGKPTLERGEYVVRGELELDPDGRPGARRYYESVGATPTAALKGLVEQMSGDRK